VLVYVAENRMVAKLPSRADGSLCLANAGVGQFVAAAEEGNHSKLRSYALGFECRDKRLIQPITIGVLTGRCFADCNNLRHSKQEREQSLRVLVAGSSEHVVRGTGLYDLTFVKYGYAIANSCDRRQVVRDV